MMESTPVWMWIAGFLLVLGPLVTLHELGHYLVGRWFGVQAEAFSIGFGRELAGWTDRHGTRWKVSALPLGGYVRFKGDMNPASVPDPASPREAGTFQAATLWQRALIVLAGPLMNVLVTLVILAAFAAAFGRLEASPVIGGFAQQSAGREAGLAIGDRILAIDGTPVDTFDDLSDQVLMYPGREVSLLVKRGEQQLTVPLRIGDVTQTDRFGNTSRIGRLGVLAGQTEVVAVGPLQSIGVAFDQTAGLLKMMATGVAQIVTGQRSLQELGGPLKIAKFSGEQLSLGWLSFASFAALISINLAFINLLPIPGLDGGHLAFYAAEAIRRRPVGPRGTEWAYRGGIALVLMLMLFVTANDVVSLVGSG